MTSDMMSNIRKSIFSRDSKKEPLLQNIEGRLYTTKNPELYFRDGKRCIDYVLAYKKSDKDPNIVKKRNSFLASLANKKIEIEIEDAIGNVLAGTSTPSHVHLCCQHKSFIHDHDHEDSSKPSEINRISSVGFESVESAVNTTGRIEDEDLNEMVYVKLHASWNLMLSYADVLKFRKPLKQSLLSKIMGKSKKTNKLALPEPSHAGMVEDHDEFVQGLILAEYTRSTTSGVFFSVPCAEISPKDVTPISFPFTIPFIKSKTYLFNIDQNDKDSFFTQTERSYVVNYILRRAGSSTNFSTEHKIKTFSEEKKINLLSKENIDEEYETGIRPNDQLLAEAEEEDIDFGIAKLLKDGIFIAAYPLHEAVSKNKLNPTDMNVRGLLKRHWANWKKFYKIQPIDYIRLYFGEMVGFYFGWLGFYTYSLIIPTIIGIIVFICGLFGLNSDPIINDVCTDLKDTLMCPLCLNCQTFLLGKTCLRTKFSRILDNSGTVFFAVMMALWATTFIEMWKREQFRLAYRWNVHEMVVIEEPPRPEFIALVGKGSKKFEAKRNTLSSGIPEPNIPFWSITLPVSIFSCFILILSCFLSIGVLVGVIFFKSFFANYLRAQESQFLQQQASMFATVIGATMTLICITLLTMVFNKVSAYLTDLERHRTQTQYDDAITLKMYSLQFVNIYSSIVYVAFVQGLTAAIPGDPSPIAQYGCDGGDCLFEVFMQMVIIMVGKQILGFALENTIPLVIFILKVQNLWDNLIKYDYFDLLIMLYFINTISIVLKLWYRVRSSQHKHSHEFHDEDSSQSELQDLSSNNLVLKRAKVTIDMCSNDLGLIDGGSSPLFGEYLEMMIQFGFITIFVAAFPLAPFFALLNNVFEIRGDAKKFLNSLRRPLGTRCKDIGIWADILSVLARIAVRSNALIIAFTTDFIQRLVYEYNYREPNLTGVDNYVKFTLASMNCSRFKNLKTPCNICFYPAFREPAGDPNEYDLTKTFWHILAAKFIFVFIFENVVIIITSLLAYFVTDIPGELAILMRREASMTNEIIVSAEMNKSAEKLKKVLDEKTQDLSPTLEEKEEDINFYEFSGGQPRIVDFEVDDPFGLSTISAHPISKDPDPTRPPSPA